MNEAQIVNLPSLIMASAFTSDLEAETKETTETVTVPEEVSAASDSVDSGVLLGVFLAPFFIIIFLISVILVLALKKG